MAITPLPTPPSRQNVETFSSDADAFLGALPAFATEANVLASDVSAKQIAAANSATAASASANAASQTAGVTAWVSGTVYQVGDLRYDTTSFLTYRRKVAGAGTTRPGLDVNNWQLLTGLGDVNTIDNQTISGIKTFATVRETRVVGGSGGNYTIDLATGNFFTRTFTSDSAISVTNVPTTGTSQSVILELTNAGAYAITWPAGTQWTEGIPPVLTATGMDIVGLYTHNGGTTWNGLLLAKNIK